MSRDTNRPNSYYKAVVIELKSLEDRGGLEAVHKRIKANLVWYHKCIKTYEEQMSTYSDPILRKPLKHDILCSKGFLAAYKWVEGNLKKGLTMRDIEWELNR